MSHTQTISQFKAAKDLKFLWEGPFHKTEIEVKIPDLSHNKFNVGGDWGPMYTIDLEAESPLKIKYLDTKTNEVDQYALEQRNIKLNSPMLASEREQFPFYFKFSDERKGLDFQLYLDIDSKVSKVEVLRSCDAVKLFDKSLA